MNFIFRELISHVEAAFLSNWKTTVCGVCIAVLNSGPSLTSFFSGGWDHVVWLGPSGFLTAVGTIALGVAAKDFNISGIFKSVPKATLVK